MPKIRKIFASVAERNCRKYAVNADDLHPPLIGVLIRITSGKSRQKRMMDINYLMGIISNKFAGENLHVTRQNYQINFQPL